MTCKFFRSAAVTASALAVLSLLPTAHLAAQTPTPKPTPVRPKAGFVRFWNAAGFSFDLVLGSGPSARFVSTAMSSNFYATYVSLPPGPCPFRVYRSGDRQNTIKSFDVAMRDRSYYTLLATQEPGGQPSIELIDDTPDPAKPPNNRLTVRQFCQDAKVVITTGGNFKTDPMLYGVTQTIEGLPDGVVALKMTATKTGNNGVKTWDTQADFRVSHHSTLFVVNDLYGRIRARVAMDGPSPADEAEAAAEAKQNQ